MMSQKLLNEKRRNKLNDVNNDIEDIDLEDTKNKQLSDEEVIYENMTEDISKNMNEDANEYKKAKENLKRSHLGEGLEESALDLLTLDSNYANNSTKVSKHLYKSLDKKVDKYTEKADYKKVVESIDNESNKNVDRNDIQRDTQGGIQDHVQRSNGNMKTQKTQSARMQSFQGNQEKSAFKERNGDLHNELKVFLERNFSQIKHQNNQQNNIQNDIQNSEINIENIENKNLLSKIFDLGNRTKMKFSQKTSDSSEEKINLYRNLEAQKADDNVHHSRGGNTIDNNVHNHSGLQYKKHVNHKDRQDRQHGKQNRVHEHIKEAQDAQSSQTDQRIQSAENIQNTQNSGYQCVPRTQNSGKVKKNKSGIFVSSEMSKNYQDFISTDDFDMFTDIRKMPKIATKKDHQGHRKRMREKVLNNHADSLHDYEIFEMLIHLAQPRKDSKQTSKILLKRFSSMNEVFSADVGKLLAIDGMGAATVSMLKLIHELYCRLSKEEIANEVLLNSNHKVINYCRVAMGYLQHEEFRILFLNKKNVLIIDEVQQRGTIDQTPIFPREVVRRSIEIGAAAIIMIHNHPSGDPTPSRADIEITNQVKIALDAVGVKLHDHIVIGKFGHISMKSEGMI